MSPLLDRAQLHAGRVRAGVGLGEGRGRQHVAAGDAGQPALLLLLGAAVEEEPAGDQHAGHHRADREPDPAQLLGDQGDGQGVHAQALVFLWDGHREVAQVGHLLDDLHGNLVALVVQVVGDGRNFLFGELARLAPDGLVFTAEYSHGWFLSWLRNPVSSRRNRVSLREWLSCG